MSSVAVMGASGRMGQEVIGLLRSSEVKALDFSVGSAQDSDEFASNPNEWPANKVDAVIDFSLPSATDNLLSWCRENSKPLVSGTTGLSDSQLKAMKDAGSEIPILWSPNMSIGVAALKNALQTFASIPWFEYAIEEFHHSKKKDRPSGTALHLKSALEENIGREVSEVSAIRGGGIYGVHSVFAMSDEEVLEFKHTALNRRVFASGAVRACEWLINKAPGFYTLDDLLEDKS